LHTKYVNKGLCGKIRVARVFNPLRANARDMFISPRFRSRSPTTLVSTARNFRHNSVRLMPKGRAPMAWVSRRSRLANRDRKACAMQLLA